MAKKRTRTKNAFLVVSAGILSEIVTLICGLILPKLILSNFGSEYNGITQSISQFISYISLMRAGIGGATAAALYKPLAENNIQEVSEILAATQKFMRKIAGLFVLFIIALAVIYPTFIVTDFDWLFTASLIVIISLSTFAQYYFGFTYQILLSADQKDYITTSLFIVQTIANTIVSTILIKKGCSLHVVKLGSSICCLITPLFLYFYIRKKYKIISNVTPKSDYISQRWDATAHEVASFVNNNTDLIILTAFASLSDISVYTVYKYVTGNLKKIVNTCTVGFGAAFGDMYAKNEIDLMNENLSIFELITFSMATVLYSVAFVMILPFISVYTKGITDAEYIRPMFALFTILASMFNCFRIPYRVVVINVGHFKQTKNGAILEAIINIVVSIVCVYFFGLVGVAIGSLCALIFRTLQFALYLSNNIMFRNIKYFIKHLIVTFSIMAAVYLISKLYMPAVFTNYFEWVVYATITGIITLAMTFVTDYVLYKEDLFNLINKLKKNFFKKKIKNA